MGQNLPGWGQFYQYLQIPEQLWHIDGLPQDCDNSFANLTHWSYLNLALSQYRKTSNISCTLIGKKIVDHSDVVGAAPVGAAPTTSFST